ncbi:DUF3325 domain-containing protein [Pseudomonas sp. Marseille-Q8238]
MTIGFALSLGLALSYAGMAGLSLGMNRHAAQVWPKKKLTPFGQRGLRLGGWLLLALALLPCLWTWGVSVGIVAWIGLIGAGALLLVLLLAYRPRPAAALAGLSALVSLPLLLVQGSGL